MNHHKAQPTPHQAAIRKCNEACETGNLDGIRDLFHTGQLNADDAACTLTWMIDEDNLSVARGLLEMKPGLVELNEHPHPVRFLRDCKSLAMLKLLAEFGLDFKQHGHNVLHIFINNRAALTWLLDEQNVNPNLPLDPSLLPDLKKGVDGTSEQDHTIASLNEAAANGDISTFQYLVSKGADPSRSIALHRATRCSDPGKTAAMVDHLIREHHFDPNADDHCGGLRRLMTYSREEGSPLLYAVANGNRAAAVALLAHGAAMPGDVAKAEAVRRLIKM